MQKTKILTTLAVTSALVFATAVTPASARWNGWGGVAAGVGAGLALGALGAYGAYPSYYGYNDYPYYGNAYYGNAYYGAYGYSGCVRQQYWWRGRWHLRYVC
jgi:hypothetical protein